MSGGRPKGGGRRTHLSQRKVSGHRGPVFEHDAETAVDTGNPVPNKRGTRSATARKVKQAGPIEAIPSPPAHPPGGELVDRSEVLAQLVPADARDGVQRPKRTAAVASGNKIAQIAEMENPPRKKQRRPSTRLADAAPVSEDQVQAPAVNTTAVGSHELRQEVHADGSIPAVVDVADSMLDFSLALAQSSYAPGAGSDDDSSYGEDYDYLLQHGNPVRDSFEDAVVEAEDMIRALNERRVFESPERAASPKQRNGGKGRRKGKKTPAAASTTAPIAPPESITKPATFILAIPIFNASKKEYKNKSFIKADNPTYATARTTILAACDCEPTDAATLRFKVVMNKPTEPLDDEDDYRKLLAAVDKEEAKKKYTELVTVYIASEELANRAKEKKKGRSGANKDIPPELLTGDAVQCEWMSKLYPRFYGKCAKCGAKELCKIDASGNHGLTIPELFDWVICLVKRVPGVSLEDPPKKRMFARFWGPSVPLQDDDGIDRRGQAPPPPAASRSSKAAGAPGAAGAPFLDPQAWGLALAAAHQYNLQDSAARTADQPKDLASGDISIMGDAHRFLSIHDFLAELTASEAARPDARSRDWTIHAPRFDAQKVLHVGELEDWTVSDYIDAIGMVMGEAKTFQKLVQSNISKVIASKKDELRATRTAAAALP